jgi:hypothetical protein
MYTTKTPTSHIAICTVLDELDDAATRPVHWRKPVYEAIDELRAISAPAEQIDTAERIAIALLKLDWAIQGKDSEKQTQVREQLAALAETWRTLDEATPATHEDVLDTCEVGPVTEALERINQRHY